MPDWSSTEEDRKNHHGWTESELEEFFTEGRLAVLEPPPDQEGRVPCVGCEQVLDYISVFLPEGETQEQVVHPCHCSLTMEQFHQQAERVQN